jgi:hypothetical protein
MRPIMFLGFYLLLMGSSAKADTGPPRSTNVPRFDVAVEKGLAYLRGAAGKRELPSGHEVLVAYAMIKCGVPKDEPFISRAIAAAVERSSDGQYQKSGYYHIYWSGVDAMLLSEIDGDLYKPNLQAIASYVQSSQRSDGSWSEDQHHAGDVSISQYGVLALWACQRKGCVLSPEVVELAADFFMKKGNSDGGWAYRPGTKEGAGAGSSTHNMTMAGAGALGICRLMLYGLPKRRNPEKKEEVVMPGGLTRIDPLGGENQFGSAFPGYQPRLVASSLDGRIDRALAWNVANLQPVSRGDHNLYYYYCLERAAAVSDLGKIRGEDWFTVFGDGLLSLQSEDGSFDTASGPESGTAFALLFYIRSTDDTMKKMYGLGLQLADRGNPFGQKMKKEPTELDRLIADISNMDDFDKLDETQVEVADEIVQSVLAIDDPEKLIGQEDQLKSLMKHSNDKVRSAAVWALGRTGELRLVPLMLDGIRDNSVDVNIEAIQALRFIARKPQGFGETLAPFASLGTDDEIKKASPEDRLRLATPWREKALKNWSNWYFSVRPFDERGGFDELQLAVPLRK